MPEPDRNKLTIAIGQIAPTLGNLDRNLAMHLEQIEAARAADADLIVFPELSLTGYFLRDMVPDVAQPRDSALLRRLIDAADKAALVVGFVEESPQHRFYNAAAFSEAGEMRFVHRKVYLPTYGMFDEQRYFAAGERVAAFDTQFGRVGLLICEDFWHLSCAVILGAEEIDYLICISNSPGRGASGEHLASSETWRLLNRCYAQMLGSAVIFANRAGYEDGVAFWGGSEIVGPNGTVLGQAPELEPHLLVTSIDPAEIRRSRTYTPLARDEKLLLTIEELERIKRQRYQ
jgi:predicted amidohydrolase